MDEKQHAETVMLLIKSPVFLKSQHTRATPSILHSSFSGEWSFWLFHAGSLVNLSH